MNEPLKEFLEEWWNKFRHANYWEREDIQERVLRNRRGWEHYDLFDGYGAAAVYWYLQQGFKDPTPKKVMHELRKVIARKEESELCLK